jgi:hypothetical protein
LIAFGQAEISGQIDAENTQQAKVTKLCCVLMKTPSWFKIFTANLNFVYLAIIRRRVLIKLTENASFN